MTRPILVSASGLIIVERMGAALVAARARVVTPDITIVMPPTIITPRKAIVTSKPFNPWKRFNGIFVPLGVLTHPGLSDGAKLMYGKLCLHAGRAGICYVGRDTIAKDLGVHVATVARQLTELTEAGFIRRLQRGRGRAAVCEFLYHPALIGSERSVEAVAKMRQQEDQEEADAIAEMRQQDPEAVAEMRPSCRTFASQQSQNCDSTLKEEKNHLKESLKRKPPGVASLGTEAFDEEFQTHLKNGGLVNVPDDLRRKLVVRAQNHDASPSFAAATFLDVYRRSHEQRGIRDGTGWMLAMFETEIAKGA